MKARENRLQYLRHYAEQEAVELAVSNEFTGTYYACVVIPLFGEKDWVREGLQTLRKATQNSPKKVLAIVVVNSHNEAAPWVEMHNQECLADLESFPFRRLTASVPTRLHTVHAQLDLLVIDHTSPIHYFSSKEGVGMARKLGMDTALALVDKGSLRCELLHTTDGDALIESDYFSLDELVKSVNAAVVLHPYHHMGAYEHSHALTLYEISLRYYVLGSQYAASPYGFHTIGSTIAITPECYAAVRGFPKRNAAEDFYLLNKAAKAGRVHAARSGGLKLRGRHSDRVPFGTGTGTEKIWKTLQAQETFTLYSPKAFILLKLWNRVVVEFSSHLDLERTKLALDSAFVAEFGTLLLSEFHQVIEQRSLFKILQTAKQTRTSISAVRRHCQENFDAFQTLKFIHAVRESLFPNVEWQAALKTAPFLVDLGIMEGEFQAPEVLEALLTRESRSNFLGGIDHMH